MLPIYRATCALHDHIVTCGLPQIEDWLCEAVPANGAVGIDPFCHTIDAVRKLQAKLEAAGRRLVPLLAEGNLVDLAWPEQPPAPKDPMRYVLGFMISTMVFKSLVLPQAFFYGTIGLLNCFPFLI